jgi:hypothetical protein
MKTLQFILLSAFIFVTGLNAQTTLNGVTLPAKLAQDKTELVYNGGGIRKKMFFKIYVAGLYLPAKNKNGNDIINGDKPAAIRLQITSSVVSSDNMSESIREGFTKSTKGNTAPIQSKIDAFINIFSKEEIKEGNVFELWYVPGVGVKSYKNGKLQGTVEGVDFKKALFGIWLNDAPVDEDLKKALLGS